MELYGSEATIFCLGLAHRMGINKCSSITSLVFLIYLII